MDFINIAKQRCSVRSYTDKKVEAEKLEKILELLMWLLLPQISNPST